MTDIQPDPELNPAVSTTSGSDTVLLKVHQRGEPHEVSLTRDPPFGWWPAIVIALVAFIDRVEINLIAGALPQIQEHFGISDTMAGAIPTAASIAAAILLLPAGRLADRAPRVGAIAIVVLIWALCSVLSGLAFSFFVFFVVRIAIGAAGQLYNPPASSLISDYYPASSRGKAFGFERAGYYMGLPAGVILGGAVAEAFDWRAVFFIAAVPGVIVALIVLTLKEPVRGLADNIDRLRAERAAAEGRATEAEHSDADHGHISAPSKALFAEAKELLKIRTLRGVILSQAILSLGVAGLFYWLPTFLERTEGLGTDAASGLAGGVGGTGIVIGIVLGSRAGDRPRGPGWRIVVSIGFLFVGAVGLTGAVLLPGVPLRMAMIALACAGFAGAIPNLTASAAEIVPATSRGMGFALLQFLTTLGGAFGPLLVGFMSDTTGSIEIAMLCLIPPLFISIFFLFAARNTYAGDAANAKKGALAD